ncbi:thioesterase family protein [Sedimenticola selenatireducens]|jgi:acyl-CoA thioesterase FadM|uniref:Thioesterase n=1 Tax=Sedimenticola selenatireducens TaxID=191960 RepID=A0A557RSQ3_9GAMM|nr:thioesterase family protein [Sedimenticola selenatireducens]TVO68181.1 thioesterase [Sedimenticola selenatireducens]TVT66179.1 MAG: thioesterase [Sedimenticola selenatireducens]
MNLLFRLIFQLITSRFRPQQSILDAAVLQMRVWPTDLDINRHLTNSRYLALMDLGRIELMLRTGMMGKVLKRRWLPVVSIATLRFRREISPFERFSLHTRLLGWDEKWFYMEQRFETARGVAAVGIVKGLFRGPKGNVPSQELVGLTGYEGVMEKSEFLKALDAFEKELKITENID